MRSYFATASRTDLVKMMNDDLAWTEQLGTAAVNKQQELLAAIQQLRDQDIDIDRGDIDMGEINIDRDNIDFHQHRPQ